MKQFVRTFYCITVVLLAAVGLRAQESYTERARKYAETYARMAMEEQKRSGIPAAITLGQGILETEAGLSELMTQANNHFGIKCKSDWTGDKFLHTDDAPNECFKRYSCAAESYKDHSDYLHRNQRYAKLFSLSITDYKRWAVCLRQCGYATNPQYAQQLIKIIENFNLHSYTLSALDSNLLQQGTPVMADEEDEVETVPQTASGSESTPASLPDAKVLKINELKAIYVHKGESLRPYGAKFKIPYSRLLEMNDLPEGPLQFDSYIYLEKKKTLGVRSTHIVKDDETLLMVSQMEGIQLKRLMAMNMLQPNEEPVNGATLYLQSATAHKPEVRVGATVAHTSDAIVTDTEPVKTTPDNDEIPTTKAPVQTPAAQAPDPQPAAIPAVTEPASPIVAPPPVVAAPTPEPAAAAATAQEPTAPTATPPAAPTVATGSAAIPAETAQAGVAQPAAIPPANAASTQKHVIVVKTEEDTPPPPPRPTQQQIEHQEDSIAKEAELNDLKASLDKVVYADDSKLLEKKTSEGELKAAKTAEPKTVDPKAAGAAKYYTVKKGDTAFGIAKRNNITVEELYEMNHITASGVKIGKKLRIQ